MHRRVSAFSNIKAEAFRRFRTQPQDRALTDQACRDVACVCNTAGSDKTEKRVAQGEKAKARWSSSHEATALLPAKFSATLPERQLPAAKVRADNFYGANKLLLVDQRVARLLANAQMRLRNQQQAPFEHFALQRQAFAWAEAHELAKDLKYAVCMPGTQLLPPCWLAMFKQPATSLMTTLVLCAGCFHMSTMQPESAPSL